MSSSVVSIEERLKSRITETGPISIAAFMMEALFDPMQGYYATKDPIGAGADFITAPEISQMFGEFIGVWSLQSWMDFGAPDGFRLIELGPGRGTMASDALRAARAVPEFTDALSLTLIEASAALKAVQAQTLASAQVDVDWADRLERAPGGPCIILGNEFLDCLPVRQAVRHEGVWRERMVGLDDGAFIFTLGPPLGLDESLIPARLKDSPDDTLVTLRPGDLQLVHALAERFAKTPGRALFIDYGSARSEPGDTFQALRKHEKVDPLAEPGRCDLTAWVDFEYLVEAARAAGLTAYGPVEQGEFLLGLGLETRAAKLMQSRPDQRESIARQVWRLTDGDQMGRLFKAVCIDSPGLPAPPGFQAGDRRR